MSVKTPVARSRGNRSNTIGSPERIAPCPDSCPIAVCAPCETVNSSAKAPCSPKMRSTSIRIRSHVNGSPSSTSVPFTVALRSIARAASSAASQRSLRTAEARDLGGVLAPAPQVEELAVGLQVDSLGAKAIRELERERRRHAGARDGELSARAHADAEQHLVDRHAFGEQLVGTECVRGDHLDARIRGVDAHRLEGADDRDPPAVLLGIEKRVGNRDGHRVPHLRRPRRVRADQNGAHRADPIVTGVAIFRPEEEAKVRELLDALERPVELLVAHGPEETPLPGARDIDFGAETERVVEEIASLSANVTCRVEVEPPGVERYPAVLVLPEGKDVGIRYYGLPWGYELSSLLGAVLEAGRRESSLSAESLDPARGARPRARDRRLRHPDLTALPAGRAAGVPSCTRLTAHPGGRHRGDGVPGPRGFTRCLGRATHRRQRRAAVGRRRAGASLPRPPARARVRIAHAGRFNP